MRAQPGVLGELVPSHITKAAVHPISGQDPAVLGRMSSQLSEIGPAGVHRGGTEQGRTTLRAVCRQEAASAALR